MSTLGFNKKLFSKLLKKALGSRKMSEYAHHAGISLTYLSELIREQRNNPPMPPTIKKLADRAHNGVSYEELMAAAGHLYVSAKERLNLGEEKHLYILNDKRIPEKVVVKLEEWHEKEGLTFEDIEQIVDNYIIYKRIESRRNKDKH